MPWYYEVDRQQRGPVSDEEFTGLVQTGVVRAESLVWKEGWPEWRAYGAVASAGASAGGIAGADTAVCAVSGRVLPKRDMLEFEGRWVSAEHKEEFFQRLREGVSQPGEFVYAGFWPRVGAKIIDIIIISIVNAIAGGLIGGVMGALLASRMQDQSQAVGVIVAIQVVAQIVGLLIGIFYSVYFIRKQDATPGKRILGLKVLRADGSSLSKARIVGRYFSEIVSGMIICIGYLMVAFDKEERRALHDRMCDSRVVKAK